MFYSDQLSISVIPRVTSYLSWPKPPVSPLPLAALQALWRTLRNPAESISHVAYRVLGKFGGSNRKMLKESQRLHYVVTEVQGPSIKSEFTDCKASIQLPMEKVGAQLCFMMEGCLDSI